MIEYTIARVQGAVNWDDVPVLPLACINWPQYSAAITVQAQLCYDDKALHVRMQAQEPEIRAVCEGPLDMPCEDSCLEFFFCPVESDPRYFNIEFNPKGCMYLGFGTSRYDSVRLHPPVGTIVPKPVYVEGGWEISYCVPYDFIRLFVPEFKAVSGARIRANFYKCGDLTVKEHYITAFPIDIPKPDYHRPEFFQSISFE